MKKLFFLMAAAAALFTSCSKDDTIGGLSRGKVTFEVSAPELATRYGEGTTATTLQYAVYDMVENTTEGTLVDTGSATLNNKAANVAIDLVEGRTYSVIFWADAGANSPYDFNEETKTVSYKNTSDLQANQESYDAFFAYVGKDKVKVGETVTVELKRPFAQLRIETSDKERAAQLGVNVEKTGITVNAYTSFNLETGVVDGKQELTFAPTTAASATTTVDGTTYDLISMNYLLVNSKETVDVTLNFTDKISDTQEETYVRKYNKIDIQRNYRTLVRGTILTDPTNFDVTVKEGFDGDYTADGNNSATQVVSTAQEIQAAIDNAANGTPTTIVLTDDLNLNDLISVNNTSTQLTTRAEADPTLTIAAGKIITLDLNGKTLSATSSQTGKNYNMIDVNGGTLTVKNGNITTEHKGQNMGWGSMTTIFDVTAGGVLNLIDVNAENKGGTDMAFVAHLNNWGEVTLNVNNSTLKSTYIAVRAFNSGNDMNNITIKNSTLNGKYCFWVHNYKAAGDNVGDDSTLNVNIYGNNNTFTYTGKAPVLYGFADPLYFDDQGRQIATDVEMLQNALETAVDGTTIYIAADIEGDVVATQKEGVKITIEGQNKSYKGTITINGKSSDANTTAGLTIQNVNFTSDDNITADANINLGKEGDNTTRYAKNVIVKNCTFSTTASKDVVAIKSYEGGDKNLSVIGSTVNNGMHSLVQVNNVETLNIEDCKAYSKNGINLGQTPNVVIDNYTADVTGYAVRFGASSGGSGAAETYLIKNSSLKTDNSEGDAVIILRGTADNSTLTIENTTIEGDKQIDNSETNAIVIIDGVPTVNSAAGLAAVVEKGYTNINLADGEYDVYGCGGKTLTLNGSENAVLKLNNDGEDGCDYAFGGNGTGVGNITFNGLTINTEANTGNYKGFAYMKGTFNNCNFVGAYSLNNENDFVFKNCTFDFKNGYFWTWGAKSATFDACTFNGNSKAILAHGYASTVITINNCNFAATEKGYTGSGDHTACVEIDPAGTNVYTINFTGTNSKTENYAAWTRIKDGSTGHVITGVE